MCPVSNRTVGNNGSEHHNTTRLAARIAPVHLTQVYSARPNPILLNTRALVFQQPAHANTHQYMLKPPGQRNGEMYTPSVKLGNSLCAGFQPTLLISVSATGDISNSCFCSSCSTHIGAPNQLIHSQPPLSLFFILWGGVRQSIWYVGLSLGYSTSPE
jgi:hypothetical protein